MSKAITVSDYLDYLVGTDVNLRQRIEAKRVNTHVARMIYAARTEAGLTQAQLAKLLNTKQPVIARLEDADYEGHSLSMLQRIGEVLGRRITLEWADKKGGASVANSNPAPRSACANGRTRRPAPLAKGELKQSPQKVKSH